MKNTKNKVIIASDGTYTNLFINGKTYGDHITGIEFRHVNEGSKIGKPEITISADTLPVEGSSNIEAFKTFLEHLMKEE